jgi:hypothetical protein
MKFEERVMKIFEVQIPRFRERNEVSVEPGTLKLAGKKRLTRER